MRIQYDEAKRILVLNERGLDIGRSGEVFADFHLTKRDEKHSEPAEERLNSVGILDGEVIIVVWTPRGTARRIVTMWKANGKERQRYFTERECSGSG